jgi:hypothetical protein
LLAWQVIPTVGVSGEDGEKRRAAMLEHFRNLVDGNAAKANFLSRWKKTAAIGPAPESPRETEGVSESASNPAEYPGCPAAGSPRETEGAPRGCLSVLEDIPGRPAPESATEGGVLPGGSSSGDVLPVGSSSALEEDPGAREGGMGPHRVAVNGTLGPDSAFGGPNPWETLPGSRAEEGFSHPGGVPRGVSTARGVLSLPGETGATSGTGGLLPLPGNGDPMSGVLGDTPDSERELNDRHPMKETKKQPVIGDPGFVSNPDVDQVLGVLGSDVSREQAADLLRRAGDNVGRALDMFFTGTLTLTSAVTSTPPTNGSLRSAQAKAANGTNVSAPGSHHAKADNGEHGSLEGPNGGNPAAAAIPQAKAPAGNNHNTAARPGAKRKPSAKENPGGKRPKSAPEGGTSQRRITAFFGGGRGVSRAVASSQVTPDERGAPARVLDSPRHAGGNVEDLTSVAMDDVEMIDRGGKVRVGPDVAEDLPVGEGQTVEGDSMRRDAPGRTSSGGATPVPTFAQALGVRRGGQLGGKRRAGGEAAVPAGENIASPEVAASGKSPHEVNAGAVGTHVPTQGTESPRRGGAGGGPTSGVQTLRAEKGDVGALPPADCFLLPAAQYDPAGMGGWATGQPTPYLHMARAFQV